MEIIENTVSALGVLHIATEYKKLNDYVFSKMMVTISNESLSFDVKSIHDILNVDEIDKRSLYHDCLIAVGYTHNSGSPIWSTLDFNRLDNPHHMGFL
ncbi:hypothetical protein HGT70_14320 [Rosenbergiella collisarenosi]|uniref:hypothetical protein n=1 Tax=Rosenbergiella collisarenosi TaxID=1544695 RepID=UPI001BD9BE55|nr:hypothetical protein [Rosenbergiella collisarenosi]MBT0722449.1 hypothetical protein [Rosenbergiella collisarenosi]